MKETTKQLLQEWMEDSPDERLDICKCINSYDGTMDFCDYWDIEDLIDTMDKYELARAIIYGNVINMTYPVKFNGYGNFVSVNEYELVEDSKYYIDDIIEFIDQNGFDDIFCPELEQIYNEAEAEDME